MDEKEECVSPLRKVREKRGVSQRSLAKLCGISRARLRRLEAKAFDRVTYGELRRLSEALGIELTGIVEIEGRLRNGPFLSRAGQTTFQLDAAGAGYKIASFFPPRKDFFAGKLFVSAGKQIGPLETPRAQTIFLQTLLGTLRLGIGEDTYEVREGDTLVFRGDTPYTLENPFLREAVALLLALPSFQSA